MNGVISKEMKSVAKTSNKVAGSNALGSIGDANAEVFRELSGIAIDHLAKVRKEILRVEALIDFGALVLRYTQPDIEGKVDVRWWHVDGRVPFRTPVMVRWMRAKTGKAAGRVAVPKKVKSLNGLFIGLHNASVASAVAHELHDLMAYWTSLVSMIRSMNLEAGRRMGGINRWARDLDYKEVRLVTLRDDLAKRMLNQGYGLPDVFVEAKPVMPPK